MTTPFGNPGQGVTTQTTNIAYQGNTTTVTDPAKAVKQTTNDVFGHVASVIEDVGNSNFQTNYFYDPLGDLTNVMKCAAGYSGSNCPSGQLRTFVYDGLGRLTSANNPESNTFTYSYVDSYGNNRLALQSRTDPRNITAAYSYDGAGRTVGIGYNDGITPSATYSYDAAGRLTKSSTGYVVNNYTSFDGNGRVLKSNVQINGGDPYTFQYAYDLAGDVISETYPTGRVLNTTYDIAARPATMTAQGAAKPYVVQAGYWPSGAGYYWQYGNNLYPVEGYSAQLMPWYTNAALNNDGNSYLMALGISRNPDGTVQQTAEAFGSAGAYNSLTFLYQNYNYDRLKRLLSVVDTNYSRGFNYDEFGNMSVSEDGTIAVKSGLTPQSGGGLPNPYDPGTNRLLGSTYGYDMRGDMTTLGTTTMTYDAEGRQISTTDNGVGGQSISYAFDAEGQRVAKQVAGGATVIDVHDAFGQLAVEYSSASLTAACNTCYLAYDGVGSVRLVTDENGNVVARHDYLPYGEEIPNGAAGRIGNFGYSSNLAQGFTGQELDGATATMSSGTAELEYFNARHMSAVLGSFTQPDPMQAGADFLNPQSWNGYAYVLGNPLGLVDPSGMDTNYAGLQTGVCPASQATCPTGTAQVLGAATSPNEINTGEQYYINTVVRPGFLGIPPLFSSGGLPAGSTGATICFCSAGNWLSTNMVHVSAFADVPSSYDVPVGIDIWKGQQQLWHNTAVIGNAATIGAGAAVAGTMAVGAVASLSMAELAVGPGQPWGIHFAVGAGGTWLHWLADAMDDSGNFSAQITTQSAEAWAARMAWFKIYVPILNPTGVLGAVGKPAANCFTGACYALGQGWVP